MTIQTEEELVNSFVNYTHEKNNKSTILYREVQTGYGRPDVLHIEYNENVLNKRKMSYHGPLSTLAAHMMTYLAERRWVSMEKVSKQFDIKNGKLLIILEDLLSRGLIVKNEHLIKSKPRNEILAIKRLGVYEAKLYQWKEAINQAERNLWFTNDSYILMPIKRGKLKNNIYNECKSRGIGVGFFNEETGLDILLKPVRSGVINTPFLWTINEELWKEQLYEYN
ncbi:hypothetical protein ACJEBK_22155 [Peribacillus frigoritolerans]|uniref:hypothetical protein n=1 Tax=Peribacillus frigoritolerans TaxID=450367 RepID=UPI003871DDC8